MTIVVLSDNSTYDSDAKVLMLNDVGVERLEADNDAKWLDGNHIVTSVTLGELLDLWNKIHNTGF